MIKQIWIEAVPASATPNNLTETAGYFELDDEYEQEILKNKPMWNVRKMRNEGKTI